MTLGEGLGMVTSSSHWGHSLWLVDWLLFSAFVVESSSYWLNSSGSWSIRLFMVEILSGLWFLADVFIVESSWLLRSLPLSF